MRYGRQRRMRPMPSGRRPASSPQWTWRGLADTCSRGRPGPAGRPRAAAHPVEIGEAGVRFWATLARIGQNTVARSVGSDAPPPIQAGRDKRFTDPAWEENPGFFALRQAYLAVRNFADDVLGAGHGDPVSDRKAEMALGFLLYASSPTNFLLTNPAALKRAFETGGGSVVSGARNFLDDLANNGGRPPRGRAGVCRL